MHESKLRLSLVVGFSSWLAACSGTLSTTETAKPQAPREVPAPAQEPVQQPVVSEVPAAAPVSEAPPLAAATTRRPPTAAASEDDDSRFVDVMSDEGQRARGLYFNGPMAHRLGARGVVDAVRGAGLNAAVIDIKDGEGRVTFDTQVTELRAARHVFIPDATAFVHELKAGGVYSIARVVCFNDSTLPRNEPDRAIQDGRPGHVGDIWLKNAKRNTWLDPYNTKNHDTLIAIAKEVEAMGFDEIQFDYIRFPVDVATKFAVFPAATDQPRGEVLLGFLRRLDEAIHIPIGVDVFGLTALKRGDSTGMLGQSLEAWSKHVEVISPMLYVNGMSDWMKHVTQGRAGLLVEQAVEQLRERVGPGPVIRPFLQAFERGADYYNAEFIAEQIRGVRNAGGDGFLFWHPASSYGMVRSGTLGPARSLIPFPIDARRAFREAAWQKSGASTPPPAVAGAPHEKPAS